MANPYHDSAGQFCSKGEMLAEIKQLAKDGKFQTYFTQRKAFEEIQRTSNISLEEALDDEIYNKPIISNVTPEASMISYELAKDKLGRDGLDDTMVRSLLNSRYLPEEARADIIARSSQWGIDRTIEANYVDHSLSAIDYQNIIARPGMEPSYPYIAKDHGISFAEKKLLIGKSAWGLGLLAMHNQTEFFQDKEAVESLRNSLNDPNDEYQTALTGLAHSPYEEDHERVINNSNLDKGSIPVAVTLATNPKLSIKNAHSLLKNQIAEETATSGWVADKIFIYHSQEIGNNSWGKFTDKEKISYKEPALSDQEKQALEAEIANLRNSVPAKSYGEKASNHADFLEGRLYADEKTFRATVKEHAKLKKSLARKPSEEGKKRIEVVYSRLIQARSVRKAYHVLDSLSAALEKE